MKRSWKAPLTYYDPAGWQVRQEKGRRIFIFMARRAGFQGLFVNARQQRPLTVAVGSGLNFFFRLFPMNTDARRRAFHSLPELFPRPAQDRADAVDGNIQLR